MSNGFTSVEVSAENYRKLQLKFALEDVAEGAKLAEKYRGFASMWFKRRHDAKYGFNTSNEQAVKWLASAAREKKRSEDAKRKILELT